MEVVIRGNWKDYRVHGEPDTPMFPNKGCCPFTIVTHGAAHPRPALDIVRDRMVCCSTISDKSFLAGSDVKVVWTSPFIWDSGSRYGSIQWTFDWKELLGKSNVYWVEVVKYKYPACRFLITRKKYQNHELLRMYDPTEREGPWWYDENSDTHYQNREGTCLEFLIEDDLSLFDAVKLEFVRHSDKYCSLERLSPNTCAEFNKSPGFVGARFIGQMLGFKTDVSDLALTQKQGKQILASESLLDAWKELCNRLWATHGEFLNAVTSGHPSEPALARSILLAFGNSNTEDRKALTRLFRSGGEAAGACQKLIQKSFGLTVELPLGEDDDNRLARKRIWKNRDLKRLCGKHVRRAIGALLLVSNKY